MEVEILKKADIVSYKALIDEAFDSSNPIEYYEKYMENDNYKILVIKNNREVIGSLTFYPLDLFTFSFQPSIEVFNVAVLEKYRGKKIGKQLFKYLVDYAKQNGYKSIVLTCLDTAYDAHHLYESVGMKKASSIKYAMYL